jgi:hypothetical protein
LRRIEEASIGTTTSLRIRQTTGAVEVEAAAEVAVEVEANKRLTRVREPELPAPAARFPVSARTS